MPLGQFIPPKGDLPDLLGIRQALGEVPISVGPGRSIQQAMGQVPQGPNAAQALDFILPQDPVEAAMDLIVPIAGAGANVAKRAAYRAPQVTSRPVKKAFHGSPHTFDKFDVSRIGTGEGAQAYGHGLYFAEEPAVAQSYRHGLAGRPDFSTAGPSVSTMLDNAWDDLTTKGMGPLKPSDAAEVVDRRLLQQEKDALKSSDMDWYKKIQDQRVQVQRFKENPSINKGSMFEVDLLPADDEFLLWDRPLSEQPQKVQDALRDMLPEEWVDAAPSGADIYTNAIPSVKGFHRQGKTHESVSALLQGKGIRGIKYLDQGSRGAGEGTFNYVIFDDKDVQILKMLGLIPVGIAAGAAATQGDI